MGGITSSVGIFSGLDTGAIIDSLIQAAARPRVLAEQRLIDLQIIQTSYQGINSSLNALQSAASVFRNQDTFATRSATSSDDDVLSASASADAPLGTYRFLVDRLVSTQQYLSRGFVDLDQSALGAESFTFESADARLDRETNLADLNDGAGVGRGVLRINDGTTTADIDLSRAGTVDEVLAAINADTSINVTASVEGGRFVLEGATSATSVGTATIAEDLGLAGVSPVDGAITGSLVYGINASTPLSALNDGTGVDIDLGLISATRTDFQITINDGGSDTIVGVNLGKVFELDSEGDGGFQEVEGAVSTVGGVISRIESALADAGVTDVTVSVNSETGAFQLVSSSGDTITVEESPGRDRSTAADLGLLGTASGTLTGSRVYAGLNSTLTSSLNGGAGIGGDGSISFTDRAGASFTVAGLDSITDTGELIRTINQSLSDNGVSITVGLNATGNGLSLTDTSGGSGALIAEGTGGNDTAASLGISTGATGVTASTFEGENAQLRYIGLGTRLSDLNNGQGVSTGTLRFRDSNGIEQTLAISEEDTSLGELISKINGLGLDISARINDTGDGLLIEDSADPAGAVAISVTDEDGSTIAEVLGIEGTASGTGDDNQLDGSFERVVDVDATDTLQQVITKINEAAVGVEVAAINSGAGSQPFRLSFVSSTEGSRGRFSVTSTGIDLGLNELDRGEDARVFFGSTDAASGVLLTSDSNSFDSVVSGVSLDVRGTSDDVVELSVTSDTQSIESEVVAFLNAFNSVVRSIDNQSRFNEDTGARGALFGDGTIQALRQSLFNTVQGTGENVSGRFERLVDIGVRVGENAELTLDTDRFREALEEDAAAVEALFNTRELVDQPEFEQVDGNPNITVRNIFDGDEFSALGVVSRIEELARSYINSIDGILTQRTESLTDQITNQQTRITELNERLDARRAILEAEFVAMERAIGSLQSASGTLSQIG